MSARATTLDIGSVDVGSVDIGSVLLGPAPARIAPAWSVEVADDRATWQAYRALRRAVFVEEQALFAGSDHDDADDDPRTVGLIARAATGELLGGVRLSPATTRDIGWWMGGRLAVTRSARGTQGVGPALVRAACAHAERLGALRFEATVQSANTALFQRLGWLTIGPVVVAGRDHVLMRWPMDRFARQAAANKAALGPLLTDLYGPGPHQTQPQLGGPGFVGDDGAPVPGTDVIAACDAIIPSLVERDPEWAGWCGVLVNVNDLSAMGAAPVGLLNALAARDSSAAALILTGLRRAAELYGVAILGGHTQLGVPAALSVTALGRTDHPIAGGGGRPGQTVSLTADLGGSWRPGYRSRQWDSTTSRRSDEVRMMADVVARTRPAAAKDVSMAGLVGTLGMMAEASGCAAVLDVAAVPAPDVATADWLSCFPGFAMITADEPGRPVADAGPAVTAACGELIAGAGVGLRWPDGEITPAIAGPVTGLGAA